MASTSPEVAEEESSPLQPLVETSSPFDPFDSSSETVIPPETTRDISTPLGSPEKEPTPLELLEDQFVPLETRKEEPTPAEKLEDQHIPLKIPEQDAVPPERLLEPTALEIAQRYERTSLSTLSLRIELTKQNLQATRIPITSKRVVNTFTRQLERARDQYMQSIDRILDAAGENEEIIGTFSVKLVDQIERVSLLLDQLQELGRKLEPMSLEKPEANKLSSRILIDLYTRIKEAHKDATFRLELIEKNEKKQSAQPSLDSVHINLRDIEDNQDVLLKELNLVSQEFKGPLLKDHEVELLKKELNNVYEEHWDTSSLLKRRLLATATQLREKLRDLPLETRPNPSQTLDANKGAQGV